MNIKERIKEELFSLQDEKYREFQCALMPTVPRDKVIGVRTPEIRAMAKRLASASDLSEFLNELPHRYYEEDNLHAFLIAQIKDVDECLAQVGRFLPYVDNWATCDSLRPKCFAQAPQKLLLSVDEWLVSRDTYAVRYGIEVLMVWFLDERFSTLYLEKVATVTSDEYYVNMMIAWYFATALAKQYESAIKFLEENRLSTWVHKKTIRKAVESFRISEERKKYINSLKM